MANPTERMPLLEIVDNYRALVRDGTVSEFRRFLGESFERLRSRKEEVQQVRTRATKNQNTYLTWDHMDVYFATSMRKSWEYMDLYDFIDQLMTSKEFEALDLRYFDPTQAYTVNRINKGLVEALMLKRARCTVYSVQDIDTLGKDSELASTLAQLATEDPVTILERLRFVLYADEQLAQRLDIGEYQLVDRVQDALAAHCSKRIWLSLPDHDAAASFRKAYGQDLVKFCRIVAELEKAIYDKRAQTLKESHPLALQVDQKTGVANWVLVVREISHCAALLRRILLSEMEFTLEEKDGMWTLRQKISGCIYRVVTDDRKLNNCFWNFYLR